MFSAIIELCVDSFVGGRFMVKCNILYPGYSFDKNKGYGTAEHIKNIDSIGLCNIHRKSFNIKKTIAIT